MPNLTFKPIHLPREIPGCNEFYFMTTLAVLLSRIGNNRLFSDAFCALFGVEQIASHLLDLKEQCCAYEPGTIPASLPILIRENLCVRLADYIKDNEALFLDAENPEKLHQQLDAIKQGQAPQALTLRAFAGLLNTEICTYTQVASHLYLSERIVGQPIAVNLIRQDQSFQGLIDTSLMPAALIGKMSQFITYQVAEAGEELTRIEPEYFINVFFQRLIRETLREIPNQLTQISQTIPQRPIFDAYRSRTIVSNEGCVALEPRDPCYELQALLGDSPLVKAQATQAHEIGDLKSWLLSMLKVGGVGTGAGLCGLGLSVAIGEWIIEAGVGVLAIPYVGVPVLLGCILLTAAGGAVGKRYAIQYEKTIREAFLAIQKREYDKAAEILDSEFNRWFTARAARHIFLTKEHYAIAHFFRGMSAERADDKHIKKAFAEYKAALIDAQDAGRSLVELLLRLKVLHLLKHTPLELLGIQKIEADALVDLQLRQLDERFSDSLTDLYWRAREQMALIATRFVSAETLTPDEVKGANSFLTAQSLYTLKYYENGRGAFLATIFYPFFQSVVLSYFSINNLTCLLSDTGKKLQNDLGDKKQLESLHHAVSLLEKNVTRLNIFSDTHAEFIRKPEIQKCMQMIQDFLIEFCAVTIKRKLVSDITIKCNNLLKIAKIPPSRYQAVVLRLEQSSAFLSQLHAEFGKRYDSIENWLDALSDNSLPDAQMKSAQTQDTMLHMLVQLPAGVTSVERVKATAQHMQKFIYDRNAEHHTPLSLLLMRQDDYGIRELIQGPKMISLGSELNEVDKFISNVERNIGAEGHFLLLQGSPGTGKTETVLTHLRSKGHSIIEWQGGDKEDKWVGQLHSRVIEFFEKGKKSKNDRTTILFIDEMSGVCPDVSGGVENGRYNQAAVVDEFQKQISALKGYNVILVGATNYPERLSKAIQNRMTRVIFPLPNKESREKLITHLLRGKCIAKELIERMVDLTQGWSPRQLAQMAEQIEEMVVSREYLDAAFEKSRKLSQSDFRTEFSCAHLVLPQFEVPVDPSLLIPAGAVANAFGELRQAIVHPEHYRTVRMHTLLYGPPGSGKTTAISEFAKQNNCPFILIESGTTTADIITIFERAKGYTTAIICIDEIDQFAYDGSPVKVFLQEQMDGLISNNIIIVGATNYPERIAEPIFSRFSVKVAVPLPTVEQRGLFIQKRINEELAECSGIQVHPGLQQKLQQGCLELSHISAGLSYRDLTSAFGRFFARAKLRLEQPRQDVIINISNVESCINDARLITREAVLVNARQMALPHREHPGRMFSVRGEAANVAPDDELQPAASLNR